MTTDEVLYLRELLDRMRENDPELRLFGSDLHKYGLGAPASERMLRVFERKNGVTLPSDYHSFLAEAGNGGAVRSRAKIEAVNAGAGPDYGLFPLNETMDRCDPTSPFPLDKLPGECERGDGYPGVLKISFAGCTFYSFLVVNGPAYGTVWDANIDSNEFRPTGLSFGAWYRQWMDRLTNVVLPVLAHEQEVKDVQVGMTKAQVIEICGGQWKQRDRQLHLGHLATQFKLDEQNFVERIIRHSIYPRMEYIAP